MRTIEELNRLPMRLNNTPLAIIVTAMAILSLAAFGWMFSFLMAFDLTTSNKEATDIDFFMVRIFVGLMFLGLSSGIYKLFQLFVLCLKCDID